MMQTFQWVIILQRANQGGVFKSTKEVKQKPGLLFIIVSTYICRDCSELNWGFLVLKHVEVISRGQLYMLSEDPKTNKPWKQALELLWACSSFPATLKQHCHKTTPILSLKAQKNHGHSYWAPHRHTDSSSLTLPVPAFPTVKMQPPSLADEHPEGTTRIIFSVTSIRRLCFITSLFFITWLSNCKG